MYFLRKNPGGVGDERRSQKRVHFESSEEFLVEYSEPRGKTTQLGYGCDITSAGMRFACARPPKRRDQLSMSVHLTKKFPGLRNFEVKAQVVRIDRPTKNSYFRVGCRLIHEKEETREAIRRFVDWVHSTDDFAFLGV